MKIHVADVIIDSDGRRKIRPDKVKAIAESIAEIGLLNPITVDPQLKLIAGLHRLEAHKSLGLDRLAGGIHPIQFVDVYTGCNPCIHRRTWLHL